SLTMTIPAVTTYVDKELRFEGTRLRSIDSPLIRYAGSNFRMSNTLSSVKLNKLSSNTTYQQNALELLRYVTSPSANLLRPKPFWNSKLQDRLAFDLKYFSIIDKLQDAWEEHKRQKNFYVKTYIPLLNKLIKAYKGTHTN